MGLNALAGWGQRPRLRRLELLSGDCQADLDSNGEDVSRFIRILSYFHGIDPAAAIVVDGSVVAYVEEERLLRATSTLPTSSRYAPSSRAWT
jgi:hypothetical protein